MKKSIKKLIALILCVSLLIPAAVLGVSAEEKRTDCGDDCEFYPTIIIPGLGQSSV